MATHLRLHVEPLHFTDAFGGRTDADTASGFAVEFSKKQAAGRRGITPRQGRHFFAEILIGEVHPQPRRVIAEKLPDVLDLYLIVVTQNAEN